MLGFKTWKQILNGEKFSPAYPVAEIISPDEISGERHKKMATSSSEVPLRQAQVDMRMSVHKRLCYQFNTSTVAAHLKMPFRRFVFPRGKKLSSILVTIVTSQDSLFCFSPLSSLIRALFHPVELPRIRDDERRVSADCHGEPLS